MSNAVAVRQTSRTSWTTRAQKAWVERRRIGSRGITIVATLAVIGWYGAGTVWIHRQLADGATSSSVGVAMVGATLAMSALAMTVICFSMAYRTSINTMKTSGR